MKNIKRILSEIFHFLVVKFSIYLNRNVFVMVVGAFVFRICPYKGIFVSRQPMYITCTKLYTVFDLITAHTPISAQSSNITASIFFLYFFTKAYVVGTHLNCIDLSMQFK